MRRYAEYYHRGVLTGKLIPACGSDSICYLDARQSLEGQKAQAAEYGKRRGYLAFRIMQYPILPERPLTNIIELAA